MRANRERKKEKRAYVPFAQLLMKRPTAVHSARVARVEHEHHQGRLVCKLPHYAVVVVTCDARVQHTWAVHEHHLSEEVMLHSRALHTVERAVQVHEAAEGHVVIRED